ncbi:hypothetical protein TKK_0008331 [Trichogramma kaykai]
MLLLLVILYILVVYQLNLKKILFLSNHWSNFDPEDFKIVLNGKKFAWQGVALLPFVEEQRLFKALEPYYDLLTEADKKRTVRGVYTPEGSTTLNRHSRKIETSNCINKEDDRLYIGPSNSGYSFLKRLYDNNIGYDSEVEVCMDDMWGKVLLARDCVGIGATLKSSINTVP